MIGSPVKLCGDAFVEWFPIKHQEELMLWVYISLKLIMLLGKLKCFEGIPFPYCNRKRMVIPDALRQSRLK